MYIARQAYWCFRYVYLYRTRHESQHFYVYLRAVKFIHPFVLLRGTPGPALKSSVAEAAVHLKTVKRYLNLTYETVKNIVSIARVTLILAGSY